MTSELTGLFLAALCRCQRTGGRAPCCQAKAEPEPSRTGPSYFWVTASVALWGPFMRDIEPPLPFVFLFIFIFIFFSSIEARRFTARPDRRPATLAAAVAMETPNSAPVFATHPCVCIYMYMCDGGLSRRIKCATCPESHCFIFHRERRAGRANELMAFDVAYTVSASIRDLPD